MGGEQKNASIPTLCSQHSALITNIWPSSLEGSRIGGWCVARSAANPGRVRRRNAAEAPKNQSKQPLQPRKYYP